MLRNHRENSHSHGRIRHGSQDQFFVVLSFTSFLLTVTICTCQVTTCSLKKRLLPVFLYTPESYRVPQCCIMGNAGSTSFDNTLSRPLNISPYRCRSKKTQDINKGLRETILRHVHRRTWCGHDVELIGMQLERRRGGLHAVACGQPGSGHTKAAGSRCWLKFVAEETWLFQREILHGDSYAFSLAYVS
jgi:hypothetical protein